MASAGPDVVVPPPPPAAPPSPARPSPSKPQPHALRCSTCNVEVPRVLGTPTAASCPACGLAVPTGVASDALGGAGAVPPGKRRRLGDDAVPTLSPAALDVSDVLVCVSKLRGLYQAPFEPTCASEREAAQLVDAIVVCATEEVGSMRGVAMRRFRCLYAASRLSAMVPAAPSSQPGALPAGMGSPRLLTPVTPTVDAAWKPLAPLAAPPSTSRHRQLRRGGSLPPPPPRHRQLSTPCSPPDDDVHLSAPSLMQSLSLKAAADAAALVPLASSLQRCIARVSAVQDTAYRELNTALQGDQATGMPAVVAVERAQLWQEAGAALATIAAFVSALQ